MLISVADILSAITNMYDDEYIIVHQQSAENFYEIAGFPRDLVAIDCTHIRIQSPCKYFITYILCNYFLNKDLSYCIYLHYLCCLGHVVGEELRNLKGYFSLNVQAICNADLKFMNVVAR